MFSITYSEVLFVTFNRTRRNWNKFDTTCKTKITMLLIVPEGIEMSPLRQLQQSERTFNRTRRNWNPLFLCQIIFIPSFNRTRRNWNTLYTTLKMNLPNLLIVPEGIEILSNSIKTMCLNPFNRTRRNWNI